MSGAELEQQIVIKCAEAAFDEGRPAQVSLCELLKAAGSATAQSRDPDRRKSMALQLQWAAQNTLFASSATAAVARQVQL